MFDTPSLFPAVTADESEDDARRRVRLVIDRGLDDILELPFGGPHTSGIGTRITHPYKSSNDCLPNLRNRPPYMPGATRDLPLGNY